MVSCICITFLCQLTRSGKKLFGGTATYASKQSKPTFWMVNDIAERLIRLTGIKDKPDFYRCAIMKWRHALGCIGCRFSFDVYGWS